MQVVGQAVGVGGGVRRDLATARVFRLLSIRVRREGRAGCRGVGRAHEQGKKKKGVTYLNPHKNATCSSCCVCAADARAGGLQAAGR